MAVPHQQIDTTWKVETPEGIDLHAEVAGPVPRALAYITDLLIRGVIMLVLAIALGLLGYAGQGILMICAFLLEWFYPVVFEVFRQGQTPGKRQYGIAVVNDDLTPVMPGTSFIRNLLRTADFLPFFYMAGLVSMLTTKQFRRLGDLAAGTLVIHVPPKQDTEQLPKVCPTAPTIPLNSNDQTAIIDFTRRHEQLSTPRQQELANILEPLLKDKDENAVTKLRSLGVWLLGGSGK
ncbi:RDD family protein [Parendozoicomonas sp. Alg238-R29]|uniref:RDD family protein n=1 Tax=Parendozoicomonas sp. Alg238-R29 TaxID=2993446 RepID=UPI00248F276E|nr:RDD family protein [Parendozoicomonas sp. Alg238-R29]